MEVSYVFSIKCYFVYIRLPKNQEKKTFLCEGDLPFLALPATPDLTLQRVQN